MTLSKFSVKLLKVIFTGSVVNRKESHFALSKVMFSSDLWVFTIFNRPLLDRRNIHNKLSAFLF